ASPPTRSTSWCWASPSAGGGARARSRRAPDRRSEGVAHREAKAEPVLLERAGAGGAESAARRIGMAQRLERADAEEDAQRGSRPVLVGQLRLTHHERAIALADQEARTDP